MYWKLLWCSTICVAALMCGAATARADVVTGLIGYWDFDEGAGDYIADSSPAGNHGTLINGVGWVDSAPGMNLGTALYFPGTTGSGSTRVEIPDSDSLDIATGMTMAAWIRCDDINRSAPVMAKEDYNFQESYWFGAHGEDSSAPGNFGVLLGHGRDRGWSLWDRDQGNIPLGQWVFIASTWDGSTVQHYMCDGQQLNLLAETASWSGNIRPTSVPLFIGVNGSRNSSSFLGAIDEVRLYDRALSYSDLTELCPEPASLSLLVLGGVVALRRR